MLPSLVAHTDGYKIVVGTYNTVAVIVECQMHMGGCVAFFRNGRCRYLQILLMPRGLRGVSPHSPGTVNPSAHNTIGAQGHVGGLTIWEFTAPTIL